MRGIEVLHLPEEPAPRTAIAAVIDTPSGPVRVINVHLDPELNIAERILHLRPAIHDAPRRVVVAGDFNTNDYIWVDRTIPVLSLHATADTSQAVALDEYMHRLGFGTPTASFGVTWNGLPHDQRLDSIFTRGLAAGDGAVDRTLELSDHWPLWLDVEAR
jgi:endonuclease/exonuclease/phosphatase family metal-dependent hydrolase